MKFDWIGWAPANEQLNLRIRPPALPCTLPRHSPALLPSIFEMLSTNLELPSSASSHSQRTQFLTHSLALSRRRHPRPIPPPRPRPPRSKLLFLFLPSPIMQTRPDVMHTARGQTVCARSLCLFRPSVRLLHLRNAIRGRTRTTDGPPSFAVADA